MQYTDDKKRFAELLSKFTGIKQNIISEYLKSDSVKSLIENPSVLKATDKQLQKLSELKELHNITDNLRIPLHTAIRKKLNLILFQGQISPQNMPFDMFT